ncbi:hypothetical protein H0H87_008234 [Tephrocybe sp. NHM501043]|nr:hypothetical protein H0H87_008234 [Tephrocybe sp. NHM501043]
MSRSGSRRGGDRGDYPQIGADGWAVAGGSGPPRPPPKAGDLSNFGKINKNTAMTFGPSSVFAGKRGEKRESVSRTNSSSNMFSMLSQGSEPAAESKEPEPQRKRLVLAPRSKPADDAAAKSESDAESEAEPASAAAAAAASEMTEERANEKIAEDCKEFFLLRNLDEAESYFTSLPAVHHHRLVEKFTTRAIEAKESDSQTLAQLFTRIVEKTLCTPAAFEQGFMPIAEIIDDITIDAPKAFTFFANVVKSASFDDERKARVASKSLDNDKLLELLS